MNTDLIVNGPYRISSYKVNYNMVYSKWDGYWDVVNVHLTEVRHDYINDTTVAYLANEYLVTEVPAQFLDKVKAESSENFHQIITGCNQYFSSNTKRVPDVRLLKVLSLLIDRNFITQNIIKSGIITTAFVQPYLDDPQEVKQQDYFSKNQAENNQVALELLKQAGYSKDKPLNLTLTLVGTRENNKMYVALARNVETRFR